MDPMDHGPELRRRRLLGGALVVLGATWIVAQPLAPTDRAVTAWLDRAVVAAGSTYLGLRTLNGAVSVLKESDLAVEPAGVGVSLAVGQVLDPLDDMTERASSVVVAAVVALGVERVLHELLVRLGPPLAGGAAILLGGLMLASRRKRPVAPRRVERGVAGVVAVLVTLRVAAPLALGASAWIDAHLLAPRITEAERVLEAGVVDLETLVRLDLPEEGGVWGAVTGIGRFVRTRAAALSAALETLGERLDGLIEALLAVTGLYATRLLLDAIVLPLAAVTAAWAMARAVTRPGAGAEVAG